MQQRYADLGLTKKVTGIVLKCACLGASKYPNLHFKLRFPVIYSMQNYIIFCPVVSILKALQLTLNRVNFYHIIFRDTTLKS